MSRSLHRRLVERLDRTFMPLILEDSLNHQALIRLCNACSLTYDGTRTQSVSMKKLISDLSEEFYKSDDHARTITKSLVKANEKIMKNFQRMSLDQLESLNNDGLTLLMSERKAGSVMFAIASDEREEISALVDHLAHHITTLGQELDLSPSSAEDATFSPTASPAPPEKVGKFLKEIVRLSTRLQEVESQKEEGEQKLAQFITERKALKDRIAELQREIQGLQRTNTSLEEENGRLKKQVEKLAEECERGVSPSLINQLIRDQKKLFYQIERWVKSEQFIKKEDGPGRFVEAIGETIAEMKDILRQGVAVSAIEWAGAKRTLEDIHAEMLLLHSEMKRMQETANVKRHVKHANELDRVGIFVDVQNIFYAAKQFNARLDFEKLLKTAVGNRRLIRAIAYVVQSPEVDQSGFITMLQQKNYEVKRKNLRLRSDGSAKGDWDMGMAIDMISLADRLDVVVLVSGDGDFVSLVNLIKTMGPRVEVFSFFHNTAKDLVQAADYHYSIEAELLLKLNNSNDTIIHE